MTSTQIISQAIEQIRENELIFASKFYAQKQGEKVTESAYYKTLERLCKAGELCKIAKGTYYRPKESKYWIVPPSQNEIVAVFTDKEKGTVVGYALYNSLKLTTQVSKTVEVFSSALEQQTKSIRNVLLQFCNLAYTPEVNDMIHIKKVLQNFGEIQDINYSQFIQYSAQFSESYNDKIFEQVYQQRRY